MSDQTDLAPDIGRGSSRRTVLKGAAWTAPAIVVATSAPSFASSPSTIVSISPATVPFSGTQTTGNPEITLACNVVNDQTATASVTALTVVFTATLAQGSTFGDETVGTAPGFEPAVISGTDPATRSFTFAALPASLPVAPGGSLAFNATISSKINGPATGSFVVTPNPTPAGTVSTGSNSF